MISILKIFIILICLILFLTWAVLKNENTLINQLIIYKAIDLYEYDCFKYDIVPKISKEDVKHYLSAFFTLNDWGYKNLLPKKKYNLLRPYIKKAKQIIKESENIYVSCWR